MGKILSISKCAPYLLALTQAAFSSTFYISPAGTGNGLSESTPFGTFSAAVAALQAGDTLTLLDGEYRQSLNVNKSGLAGAFLTIRAKNIGKAFINGENSRIPVTITNQAYIRLDGLKAGNSNQYVYHLLWNHHLEITRCAGFNADGAQDDNANYHIFEIAYCDSVVSEDVWAWGTGRYSFVYYGCHGCVIRRGVFRPGLYRACPHAGLAIYCTDHTLAENVIVFNARIDPASGYGGTEPWKLITGGFVCEGHDCPGNKSSKDNRHVGCIGIDNGEHWNVTPRSQPAGCFIWNEYQGTFEDMVLWKNPDKAFAHFTGTSTLPTRSLEGDPNNIIKNTGPQLLKRYVDGALTSQNLWPWPYEDLIKQDMGMTQTITEYVRTQLAPYVVIPTIGTEAAVRGNSSGSFSVFPNPLREKAILAFEGGRGRDGVQLFNVAGRRVLALQPVTQVLDAAALPAGIYLLKSGAFQKKIAVLE